MGNHKLISFDIISSFGFLKKPDMNEGIYLTYNFIHKPALLGLLGAIIGLGGYFQSLLKKSEFPEYLGKLGNIKMGIKPITKRGIFNKIVITYNNSVGYANDDGNLIIKEQTLVKPHYRIFMLLDTDIELENTLLENIKMVKSEFIPYLGKNDFQVWWQKESFKEYEFIENPIIQEANTIASIFKKPNKSSIKSNHPDILDDIINFSPTSKVETFLSFERIPVRFSSETYHYKYDDFVFTNYSLSKEFLSKTDNLYWLEDIQQFVQLN